MTNARETNTARSTLQVQGMDKSGRAHYSFAAHVRSPRPYIAFGQGLFIQEDLIKMIALIRHKRVLRQFLAVLIVLRGEGL